MSLLLPLASIEQALDWAGVTESHIYARLSTDTTLMNQLAGGAAGLYQGAIPEPRPGVAPYPAIRYQALAATPIRRSGRANDWLVRATVVVVDKNTTARRASQLAALVWSRLLGSTGTYGEGAVWSTDVSDVTATDDDRDPTQYQIRPTEWELIVSAAP